MENQIINTQKNQSSETELSTNKSRRNLLIGIMASVGVAATTGCVENVEKSFTKVKKPSDTNTPELSFYTSEEYRLTSILSDLIIPDTETKGALAVGVPLFMDSLYTEWASKDTQVKHRKAHALVKQTLDTLANQDFISAPVEVQLSALNTLDQQAFSNTTEAADSYRGIKSLIARFYYFSEVGASQELRYELVPGKWEPCVPVEKIGRTWAA